MFEYEGTAAALIAAGTKLFARRGYDGTSVREITRRAGANVAAVGYHFGSKEGLWLAVLEAGLRPLREAIAGAAARPGPALDRIEGAVRAMFGHVREHADLNGLMLHVLASAPPLPEPALRTMQLNSTTMRALIEAGQAEGTIGPGDPRLLALSVASQPMAVLLARPALEGGAGIPLDGGEAFDRLVENAVRFVRSGLAVDPAADTARRSRGKKGTR
ncbi:MAG: TetR family transcriptional regulator [Gemmatimonadota bacterium]